MGIDAISGTQAATAAAGASKKDQLGQDQFLQLMIAQLRHQDPTSPVDPADFLGQLAQFGTVTGIQGMQNSMTALADSLRSSQVLGGTNLVGHDVLFETDTAWLGTEGEVYGSVEIPQGTRSAQLVITDSTGQQVQKLALPTAEGEVAFAWDGTTSSGERALPGEYTIEVVADVAGASEQLSTSLAGRVGSVTIDPATSSLTLNTELGPISLGRVRRVM